MNFTAEAVWGHKVLFRVATIYGTVATIGVAFSVFLEDASPSKIWLQQRVLVSAQTKWVVLKKERMSVWLGVHLLIRSTKTSLLIKRISIFRAWHILCCCYYKFVAKSHYKITYLIISQTIDWKLREIHEKFYLNFMFVHTKKCVTIFWPVFGLQDVAWWQPWGPAVMYYVRCLLEIWSVACCGASLYSVLVMEQAVHRVCAVLLHDIGRLLRMRQVRRLY